uniref:HSF-type DNA-binding domain-containing protein n=1 Tax=Helicotheca tamesis TaxID=374047 RepID=A0A7S2HHP5_9STRA|mmetsp:Transcript_18205/g.25054  ORF Transcript_18205/g.25054 Transcript_18205/m.25054 type:complete len:387 (+) Transcript_18205:81-1241(+)
MKRPAPAVTDELSNGGSEDKNGTISCLSPASAKRRRLSLLMAASCLANLVDGDLSSEKSSRPRAVSEGSNDLGESSRDVLPSTTSRKTFPQVLMEALSSEEAAGSVKWLPNREAFDIIKPYDFASKVLPVFFKQSQFESFIRKLNRWGFRRIIRGPDSGAFYHPLFRRDKPELCVEITCKGNDRTSNAMPPKKRGSKSLSSSAMCLDKMQSIDLKLDKPLAESFSGMPPRPFIPDALLRPECREKISPAFSKMLPVNNDAALKKALELTLLYKTSPQKAHVASPMPSLSSLLLRSSLNSSLSRTNPLNSALLLKDPEGANTTLPRLSKIPSLGSIPVATEISPLCKIKEPSAMLAAVKNRHHQLLKRTQQSRTMLQRSGLLTDLHP